MKQINQMLIVGLTGQTGAGKSTVRKMFADRGAQVLDADQIARGTIEGSSQCLADLVLEFSTEIITPDAALNRAKLAELCFSDPVKLKRLNDITYPHIIRNIEGKIEQMREQGAQLLVLDAPTLYESGLNKRCDKVAAVLAQEETRVRRIISRDGINEDTARLRVQAQHDDEFYTARADYIIQNDDDKNALRVAFLDLYGKLEQMMRGMPEAEAAPEQPEQQPEETPSYNWEQSDFDELTDDE